MRRNLFALFLFICFYNFAQNEATFVDSLLNSYVSQTDRKSSNPNVDFQFSKEKIDSINNLKVQGVNISQDSLRKLLMISALNAKTINYKEGLADAYSNLAVNYYYQGNYKANVAFQLEAIKIYESLNENALASRAYGELGYQTRRRDLKMANLFMQKAIKLAKKDSLKAKIQDTYNNYSILKLMESQYDSAKYYAKKGLHIKEILKDSFGIPYSYSNIGNIYVEEGNLTEALKNFDTSLNLRRRINDSIGMGENHTQIAEVYKAQGNYTKALENFYTSMVLADKKHYANLQSYNYYQVSEIYKANKNVDSALSYLERHLVLKDSLEGQAVLEELAALRIQFDSEKKEKEILNQRTEIAESKLAINQKNSLIIGLVILAVVLSLLGYLIYNQQKLRNSQLKKENELKIALAKIETQNRLQEQRLSISRDLHDNIGAQLTFVISSIDNLKYGSTIKDKKLENKLEKISDFTSSTIIELRDTIWAMNKSEITYEDLKIRTINFLEKADFAAQNINFEFKTQSQMDEQLSFSSFKGMNIYRIIQEAVNNAIKYAEASNIDVNIYVENERVIVDVRDNGKGFDVNVENDGNGLNNIKKRAADIGAELDINSSSNGTQIKLMV